MKDYILFVKEKIGYGMGDVVSYIIFDNVMLYMMFFYIDIFGIFVGFVGIMFLLVCVLDVIFDLCMGLFVDCICSCWGKFCLWIFFGVILFGFVCVLVYSLLDLSYNGKLIYVVVIYMLLILFYIVVNIFYCVLGGVIIDNLMQCILLQFWCFVLVMVGGMFFIVLMMLLVNFIGGEDKVFGFQGGIVVLLVIVFLMLVFCFFIIKECVEVLLSSILMCEDLCDIWCNDQWWVVGVFIIFNIFVVCVCGGVMMYYIIWIMGLVVLFIVFFMIYCVGNLIGLVLVKLLIDWKCKVSVFWWINVFLVVFSVVMFFVLMDVEIIMFVFIFVIGVLYQLVMLIQWVMMFDIVDYGEWCNGKCLIGISFVGILFVFKLGLVLGGVLIGWMLVGGGYDVVVKIQNSVIFIIIIVLFIFVLVVCYLLSVVIVKCYYMLKMLFLKKMMVELVEGVCCNE